MAKAKEKIERYLNKEVKDLVFTSNIFDLRYSNLLDNFSDLYKAKDAKARNLFVMGSTSTSSSLLIISNWVLLDIS